MNLRHYCGASPIGLEAVRVESRAEIDQVTCPEKLVTALMSDVVNPRGCHQRHGVVCNSLAHCVSRAQCSHRGVQPSERLASGRARFSGRSVGAGEPLAAGSMFWNSYLGSACAGATVLAPHPFGSPIASPWTLVRRLAVGPTWPAVDRQLGQPDGGVVAGGLVSRDSESLGGRSINATNAAPTLAEIRDRAQLRR